MSKFGGGSSSSNDKIIKEQKRQAEEAERKEKERQDRLRAGRERIQAMFSEGGGTYTTAGEYEATPVYGQPSGLQGLLGGLINVTPPSSQPAPPPNFLGGLFGNAMPKGLQANPIPTNTGGGFTPPTQVQTGTKWELVPGEEVSVDGIGTDFYDKYRNSILGYYQPEVERQHTEAKAQNIFDLARRGMLRSSVAANNAAELLRERADADTRVAANAENQTAGLRSDISRAERNALSLLQSTEDPTAAVNSALTEVNAIQSQAPNFSPLGDLFSAAARSYAGWQQDQNRRRLLGLPGTSSPTASTGRNFS